MSNQQPSVSIADAIERLREELSEAINQSMDKELRFKVTSPIELKLQLGLSHNAEAKGGFQFGVVSFSSGGGASQTTTHTVKLLLERQLRQAWAEQGATVPNQLK